MTEISSEDIDTDTLDTQEAGENRIKQLGTISVMLLKLHSDYRHI